MCVYGACAYSMSTRTQYHAEDITVALKGFKTMINCGLHWEETINPPCIYTIINNKYLVLSINVPVSQFPV